MGPGRSRPGPVRHLEPPPPMPGPSPIARLAALAVAAFACVALAGCGGSGGAASTTAEDPAEAATSEGPRAADERTVHAVLPLRSSRRDYGDMVQAMRLALADSGGRAGAVRVRLVVQDDAPLTGPAAEAASRRAAVRAAADPRALAVLGSASSGKFAEMAPVLNRAGLLQVAIISTAVRLTKRADGTAFPPADIAPTGRRTVVRVVPDDSVQARALVEYMEGEGVSAVEIVHDGGTYGEGLARGVAAEARRRGLRVAGIRLADSRAPAAQARRISLGHGQDSRRWALLTAMNDDDIMRAMAAATTAADPSAVVFVPDAGALASFHGYLGPLERRVYITTYGLPPGNYGPRGVEITARLRELMGHVPPPNALFAYEAMQLALSSIARGGPTAAAAARPIAAQRRAVVRAAFATRDRASVIGTYSISITGDTTTELYGGYRVENGDLVRGRAINTGAVR